MAEPAPATERHGYETRDVSVRGVIWVGVGLGIGAGLVALGALSLADWLTRG